MAHWPSRFRRYRHLPGLVILLVLAAFLVSYPVISVVMGATGPVRNVYERYVPADADSVFLTTHSGYMELYPWGSPQSSFPSDAPIMDMGVVREFLVARPALDLPSRFQLINLHTHAFLPMHTVKLPSGRRMRLIPDHSIPPGRYLLLTPPSGMDDGNTWYYFAVVRRGGRT